MAKKEDNYSWLDKYSTDPRDTDFRDITERHRDRQQYNTDRDAHDRKIDGLNLAGSGTSAAGLYDDLVFDATRGHAPTAPPTTAPPTTAPPTTAPPTTAPPATPAAVPPPPGSSIPPKRRVAPAPPPPPPPMAQRPERLPSIELAPLKPSPRVQRLPQPVPLHRDDASLFERLRKVPRAVYLPLIFGVLFLVSSLSDSGDTQTSDAATDRSPGAGTLISNLTLGDCFLDPPAPRVASVQTTGCTRAHGGQVYAIVTGSLEEALQGCEAAGRGLATEVLRRLPDDVTFTLLINEPNHRCVLLSASRGLVGSVTSD